MRGSWFTFAAGRRAKWLVFAAWFLAIFIAVGPANLPGKFADAENNEATSYLPESAESTHALDRHRRTAEGGNRPGGDHLPQRVRADTPPIARRSSKTSNR